MLEFLKLKRQADSYSCGAYVMPAVSTFAVSRGEMPTETFKTYGAGLTEKYCWTSANARFHAIMDITFHMKSIEATSHDVSIHEFRNRGTVYKFRRKGRERNVLPSGKGIPNMEERSSYLQVFSAQNGADHIENVAITVGSEGESSRTEVEIGDRREEHCSKTENQMEDMVGDVIRKVRN